MIAIGKTVSTRVVKTYRLVKALVFGRLDVKEVNECMPFGIDSNPIAGMDAIYATTSVNGLPVIIGYVNRNQLAQPGENRSYSTDADGGLKFYIWQHSDGTCEIGGSTKHMVRFEELKTGFDQLKSDFNSFITTYNSHIHTGVTTGGGVSGTTTPGTPSAASIDSSKINEIKTL